jgi:hypothetical protein
VHLAAINASATGRLPWHILGWQNAQRAIKRSPTRSPKLSRLLVACYSRLKQTHLNPRIGPGQGSGRGSGPVHWDVTRIGDPRVPKSRLCEHRLDATQLYALPNTYWSAPSSGTFAEHREPLPVFIAYSHDQLCVRIFSLEYLPGLPPQASFLTLSDHKVTVL